MSIAQKEPPHVRQAFKTSMHRLKWAHLTPQVPILPPSSGTTPSSPVASTSKFNYTEAMKKAAIDEDFSTRSALDTVGAKPSIISSRIQTQASSVTPKTPYSFVQSRSQKKDQSRTPQLGDDTGFSSFFEGKTIRSTSFMKERRMPTVRNQIPELPSAPASSLEIRMQSTSTAPKIQKSELRMAERIRNNLHPPTEPASLVKHSRNHPQQTYATAQPFQLKDRTRKEVQMFNAWNEQASLIPPSSTDLLNAPTSVEESAVHFQSSNPLDRHRRQSTRISALRRQTNPDLQDSLLGRLRLNERSGSILGSTQQDAIAKGLQSTPNKANGERVLELGAKLSIFAKINQQEAGKNPERKDSGRSGDSPINIPSSMNSKQTSPAPSERAERNGSNLPSIFQNTIKTALGPAGLGPLPGPSPLKDKNPLSNLSSGPNSKYPPEIGIAKNLIMQHRKSSIEFEIPMSLKKIKKEIESRPHLQQFRESFKNKRPMPVSLPGSLEASPKQVHATIPAFPTAVLPSEGIQSQGEPSTLKRPMRKRPRTIIKISNSNLKTAQSGISPSLGRKTSIKEEVNSPVYERDIMSPATVAARARHRSLKKTMKQMDKNREQRNAEEYNKMLKQVVYFSSDDEDHGPPPVGDGHDASTVPKTNWVYVMKRMEAQNKIMKNLEKIQELTQPNLDEEPSPSKDEFPPQIEAEEYLQGIEATPDHSQEDARSGSARSNLSFNPLSTAPLPRATVSPQKISPLSSTKAVGNHRATIAPSSPARPFMRSPTIKNLKTSITMRPTVQVCDPIEEQNENMLDPMTSFYLDSVAKEIKEKNAVNSEVKVLKKELMSLVQDKIELIANQIMPLHNQKMKQPVKKKSSHTVQDISALVKGTFHVPRKRSSQGLHQIVMGEFKKSLRKRVLEKQKQLMLRRNSHMMSENIRNFLTHQVTIKEEEIKQEHEVKRKRSSRAVKALIRKFFCQSKFDLRAITRLVRMQNVMELLFPHKLSLEAKYRETGGNLWSNNYLEHVRSQYEDQGLFFDDEAARFDNCLEDSERVLKTSARKVAQTLNTQGRIDDDVPELPNFAQIKGRNLYLTEATITVEQGSRLIKYLSSGKTELKIISLTLDQVTAGADPIIPNLLLCLFQHHKLKHLVLSRVSFGLRAAKIIGRMSFMLITLALSHIDLAQSTIILILQDLLNNKKSMIQKLKLSNMNLNHPQIISLLKDLILEKPLLSSLDLSWGKLQPKHLRDLTEAIGTNPNQFRSLNLSYNTLYEEQWDDENQQQSSEEFLLALQEFISSSNTLGHIELSGMNMTPDQLRFITEALANSASLAAVHINDNGLMIDKELRAEILEKFGITNQDAIVPTYKINHPVDNFEELKNLLRKETQQLDPQDILLNNFECDTQTYVKHVWHGKQSKYVNIGQLLNQTQTSEGLGRLASSSLDSFLITRKVNMPELVYNLRTEIDAYFDKDSGLKWTIAKKCFVCEKHRYTLIFFDQREDALNPDLIEVTNHDRVDQIKKDINFSLRDVKDPAPFIFGSVVAGNGSHKVPPRKLKMLRTDLFSLMRICHSKYVVQTKQQINALKDGVLQFANTTQNIIHSDILEYFLGWEHIIYDSAFRNQLTDVKTLNMPEFLINLKEDLRRKEEEKRRIAEEAAAREAKKRENSDYYDSYDSVSLSKSPKAEQPAEDEDLLPSTGCDIYVYAAILPPGRHSFLIYSQKMKKAFVKSLVIDMNQKDLYPEYPEIPDCLFQLGGQERQDVWAKWRTDTEESRKAAFDLDTEKRFGTNSFLKDEAEREAAEKELLNNFEIIQIVYQEGIVCSSTSFPELGFDWFQRSLQDMQTNPKEKKRLQRSQMELSFIGATRFDKTKGVSGSLNRGKFFEAILRLCKQISNKDKAAVTLKDFIEVYMKPQLERSPIIPIRKIIRASQKLNWLLFDNRRGLHIIYSKYSRAGGQFDFDSAKNLATIVWKMAGEEAGEMDQALVRCCFIRSKMTVIDEANRSKDYSSLEYVEFLEFLCRYSFHFWSDLPHLLIDPAEEEEKERELMKLPFAKRKKMRQVEEGPKIEKFVLKSLQGLWTEIESKKKPSATASRLKQKMEEFPPLAPIAKDG